VQVSTFQQNQLITKKIAAIDKDLTVVADSLNLQTKTNAIGIRTRMFISFAIYFSQGLGANTLRISEGISMLNTESNQYLQWSANSLSLGKLQGDSKLAHHP